MIRNKDSFLLPFLFGSVLVLSSCTRPAGWVSSTNESKPGKENTVECTIDIRLDVHRELTDVLAVIIFKNSSDASLSMLKRNLLYDGKITFAAFKVTKNDKKIPYSGVIVDTLAPTKDDWYALDRGQAYETTIRLSDHYDFSSPGEYQITYQAPYDPWGEKFTLLESNSARLVIEK